VLFQRLQITVSLVVSQFVACKGILISNERIDRVGRAKLIAIDFVASIKGKFVWLGMVFDYMSV